MVGFWVRAGKTIVGTKPGAKFKGQKTKESIIKKSKEFKSKIEKDKPVVKHYYAPKDFLK
jgi:hypothetical protein